jgi:hypothetical protein
MPTAPLTFLAPVTSPLSSATPDTIVFDQQQAVSNTARLGGMSNFTSAAAPSTTSGASQLIASGVRTLIDIVNPTDGKVFYIGSATVTPAIGVPVYPGSRIQMIGYIGAVWSVSGDPSLTATFFYRTS